MENPGGNPSEGELLYATLDHAITLHEGGTLLIGLPTETFVAIIMVPLIVSLLLLFWALRW